MTVKPKHNKTKKNKTKKNKRLKRRTRRRTNKKFSKKISILKKYKMKTKRFIGGEEPTEEEEEFMKNYIELLKNIRTMDLKLENLEGFAAYVKNLKENKETSEMQVDWILSKLDKYNEYTDKFNAGIENRKKTIDNETILLKKFEERIETMKKNGEDTGEKYEKLLAKTTEMKESILKLQSAYDTFKNIIEKGSMVSTSRMISDLILPKEEIAYDLLDSLGLLDGVFDFLHTFLLNNRQFLNKQLPYDTNSSYNVKDTAFLYAVKTLDKEFITRTVMLLFYDIDPDSLDYVNTLNQNAIFVEVFGKKMGNYKTIDKMIRLGMNPNIYGKVSIVNTSGDGTIFEFYIPPIILAIILANSLYHELLKTNGEKYLQSKYANSKECVYVLLLNNVNVTDTFVHTDRVITPLEFVLRMVSDSDIVLLFLDHLKKLDTEIELLSDETIIDSFLSKNSKYNEIKASYYILKENQKKITEQKKEKQLTEQEKRAEQIRKQLLQQEQQKQEQEKKNKEKKEKKQGSNRTTPSTTPITSPTNIPITPKNTPITTPINVPSLAIEENTGFIPISIDAPPVVVVNYDKLITEDYARIYEDSNDITEAIDFFKKYTTAEQLYKFKEVLQTTFSGKFEPTLPDDIVNFELFSLFEKCIGFLSKLFYEKTLCLLLIKGSEATRKILRIETTPDNYTDLDIMIVPLNTTDVSLKTISKNIAVYIKYVSTSISRRGISYILPDNYKIVKVSARQSTGRLKAILDIDYNYDELLPYIKELYSNKNIVIKEDRIGPVELSYNCLGLRSILKEKMYYIVKYTNYPFLLEAVSRSTPARNDPNVYYLNKTSSQLNQILEIMVKGREENIKKKTELKKEKLEKKKLEKTDEVIGESPEISLKSKTKEDIMSEYWEDVIQANLRENDRLHIPEPFVLGLYITRNENLSFIMVYPDSRGRVSITIPKN
jgi:hypothetical protein